MTSSNKKYQFSYYKPLYNGNISAMAVNVGQFHNPMLYNYQYDQLNRIVQMDAMTGLDTTNNTWNALTALDDYQERVAYDANGNILRYKRNGTTANSNQIGMDSLTYHYNYDGDGYLTNNRLTSVSDSVPSTNYPNDIDNQSANNYHYDEIGNLTYDGAGGISNITWTVYGKIASITKTSDTTVTYTYDAAGNRISKTVTPPGDGQPITTWYVRDGSGNTMAVYSVTGSDSLRQTEQDLYGSSRLGVYNRNINADEALPTGTNANLIGNYVETYFTRGNKQYELTNQTGNVMVTVSDTKTGIDTNGDGIVDYYTADVISANDYYPFGMVMPSRKYSIANTNYRYSFNGKEDDNDIEMGMQDYGNRIYDRRLGKFLSVDPISKKYPELTTYQFASNSPISSVDLDGKESEYYTRTIIYTEYHYCTANSDKVTMGGSEIVAGPGPNPIKTGILAPNGTLGSGTMYTLQTQVKDVEIDANGQTVSVSYSNPITIKQYYKLSKQDEMKRNVDSRPMFEGAYQIMVFGSSSDNAESPGERANPNAKTETFDMNAWNDFMEPILTGMEQQEPENYEPPTLEDVANDQVDELKRKAEKAEHKKEEAERQEDQNTPIFKDYPHPGIKPGTIVNFGPTNSKKINDSTFEETTEPATDTSPVWKGYKGPSQLKY